MNETPEAALSRIRSREANANDTQVLMAFHERGIPMDDIHPRENVLTFKAWLALGRVVMKGEKAVRITTWISAGDDEEAVDDNDRPKVRRFPKSAFVFHISQTRLLEA